MQNFKSALILQDAQQAPWLLDLRGKHWHKAQAQGLPNAKLERWKYNRTKELAKNYSQPKKQEFQTIDQLLSTQNLETQNIAAILELLQESWTCLVFVNGFLAENLSKFASDFSFVNQAPNMLKNKIENFNYPSLKLVEEENHLQNLHLALLQNNYYINITKTQELPLVILHFNTQDANQATSVGYEVVLEANTNAQILELHFGTNSNLNLILQNFVLQQNSKLDVGLYNETKENAALHQLSYLQQAENSNYKMQHLNLSEGWTRNDFVADLTQTGANFDASGVFFGKNKAELDLHLHARHLAGQTNSSQLYKYILDDRSQGIFNSGVFVARDSQKIDSMQRSANLLISEKAKMNAKPELEIYADDVKCAHGASSGTLDMQALFAMQARGISKNDAIDMLTLAFANQVLEEIDNKSLKKLAQLKILKQLNNLEHNLLQEFTEDF